MKTSAQLTREQDAELDRLARKQRTSRAALVRKFVDRGLRIERIAEAAAEAAESVA